MNKETFLDEEVHRKLRKQGYQLVGNHSAAKLCHWLRKSLMDEGFCYKQKFYGIKSHRCLQMTPAVSWCTQKCIFCWRNTRDTMGISLEEYDSPDRIIDEAIKAQRIMLTGYGGVPDRVNHRKLEEAQNPNQAAISLSGEPTIYPRLSDLLEKFHKRDFTTFLVTNGTLPDRIRNLDELPSQLYISVEAPNKDLYEKICNPLIPDAYEKVRESLSLLSSLDTRSVLRITAIKGMNMSDPEGFASLIEKADPDFIEVKAFMLVGGSRKRLTLDEMPSHEELKGFARKIADKAGYEIEDEDEISRVVLLK